MRTPCKPFMRLLHVEPWLNACAVQSQEESTSLAVQLSEGQKQVHDLQDRLERAQAEGRRMQEVRAASS